MEGKSRQVTIQRINPNRVTSTYANDMIVARTENEIYLTFSQIEPPFFTTLEEVDKVVSVDAIAVTKLVITPEFANAIVSALSGFLKPSKTEEGQ